ncbi:MAG: hypothetical protein ABJB47_07100 [Actinomycetota bacterium]
MAIRNERNLPEKLTEPLESVTAFFGVLMLIALGAGAYTVFGQNGGALNSVCVTDPGTEYHSSRWTLQDMASARPGNSISVTGSLQACADHPSAIQRVLNGLVLLPAVLFWSCVLLLLWRMIAAARRTGPFTPRVAVAMRRLGWFIIVGSTAAAVIRLVALDQLLVSMARLPGSPFPNLLLVPAHMPIPLLTGAALLTFARIIKAGAAMDDEIKGTV